MKHRVIQLIIFSAILAVNVAFATSAPGPAPDNTASILMWVIGGLCTLLFSISAFVLSKVDRNQSRLFELHDQMVKERAADRERLVKIETKCELESCKD